MWATWSEGFVWLYHIPFPRLTGVPRLLLWTSQPGNWCLGHGEVNEARWFVRSPCFTVHMTRTRVGQLFTRNRRDGMDAFRYVKYMAHSLLLLPYVPVRTDCQISRNFVNCWRNFWQLEVDYGGSIYTTQIGKQYKGGLFFFFFFRRDSLSAYHCQCDARDRHPKRHPFFDKPDLDSESFSTHGF